MPPAIPIRAAAPRSLAAILDDIREARRDYDQALSDMRGHTGSYFDADDRATEAESRIESLREEFDANLFSATGLTVAALNKAYVEVLI